MKIYLVGGAVRDKLLGRKVTERDWVVVGATPEQMIAKGFRPVGKEFPVFLHPKTKEEYALARTERKVARGYKGFEFYAAPEVTLEEDLQRRDLTINAIAESKSGKIIDPYHGRDDIQNKVLRHVSTAFAEDPVRILRLARLAARLPDFSVNPQTNNLMQQMVKAGEVDALVPERVCKELVRALVEEEPVRFFEVLHHSAALVKIFPEITMDSVGIKKLKLTDVNNAAIRFAVLLHDCGRDDIKQLCKRLHSSRQFQDLALLVAENLQPYNNVLQATPKQLLALLQKVDAFRRQKRLQQFLQACEYCDADTALVQQKTQKIIEARRLAMAIDTKPLLARKLSQTEMAAAIKTARLNAIRNH